MADSSIQLETKATNMTRTDEERADTRVGTIKFGQLRIDPLAYGSQGSAVLGIRDSGKTYTATLLAERLFDARIPFIAFDPVGVWRFLRVPGKGRGYPVVVAGGQEGDLTLSPATAPAIVEAAMQQGISLVIDLFSMELSKSDWRKIVRDCVTLLLHRNKPHGMRHVFIEEAAEFIPQRVFDGEVYAAVEKLARMGGNSRLGYTLINQRAEEVNKAVLELCDNLFLHRQKGKNSLLSLQKWLDVGNAKDGKQIIESLSTLPTGECWAWLGGTDQPVLVKVPAKNSLHPDRRVMRDTESKPVAAVDVGKFVTSLKDALPKLEAESKANDPKELRAEVARLKKQLAAGVPAAPAQDLTRERSVAYNAGWAAAMKDVAKERAATAKAFSAIKGALERAQSFIPSALVPDESAAPVAPAQRVVTVAPRPVASVIHGDLTRPQQRVIDAVAWWDAAGHERPTRPQVAGVAGYSPSSGGFNNLIGGLNSAGLLEVPAPGTLRLTTAGQKAANSPGVPTTEELHERVRGILSNPQAKLFNALVAAYPDDMSRNQLAEATEYSASSGGFNNLIGSLSSLEIVTKPRSGTVRAAEWLFI